MLYVATENLRGTGSATCTNVEQLDLGINIYPSDWKPPVDVRVGIAQAKESTRSPSMAGVRPPC